MLFFVLVCAVLFTYISMHVKSYYREQRAVGEIEEFKARVSVSREPRGPWWLRKLAKGKYAERVIALHLADGEIGDTDLAKLAGFSCFLVEAKGLVITSLDDIQQKRAGVNRLRSVLPKLTRVDVSF